MIDPNIALSFKSPEIPDPTEVQARALQLQNAKQQLQSGALDLQMKQRDLQDQEIMRQSYMDSNGDLNQFERLIMGRGASPKAIFAFKQQMLAQKEQLAKTNKEELANTAERHDQLRGAMQSFAQQSPDFKQQNWQTFLKQQANAGNMTPAEYQQHLQNFSAYPGDDQLKMDMNSLATGSQLAKEVVEQQNAASNATSAAARQTTAGTGQAKFNSEKAALEADAAKKQRENLSAQLSAAPTPQGYTDLLNQAPHGVAQAFPPADKVFDQAGQPVPAAIATVRQLGMSPDQQATTQNAAANLDLSRQREAREASQGAQRIGIERENSRRQQAQFDATYGALLDGNGKPMDPEAAKAVAAQDPAAVAVANYQVPPPSFARGGPGAAIMRKVLALNPTYNAQNWQAQSAVLKDFTSGKVGGELRATNTALSHVGMLNDAIDALNNNDIRVLNSIANGIGLATGSTPAAVFKTIVGKVGPELGKAYGEATGSERGAEKENFDPNLAPGVLKANAAVTAKLLQGKIASTQFQWKSTMGDRPLPMISPEAQRTLDQLTGGGPQDGGRLAPLPATLSSSDVGKVYVSPKTGRPMKITAVNPQNPKLFTSEEVK